MKHKICPTVVNFCHFITNCALVSVVFANCDRVDNNNIASILQVLETVGWHVVLYSHSSYSSGNFFISSRWDGLAITTTTTTTTRVEFGLVTGGKQTDFQLTEERETTADCAIMIYGQIVGRPHGGCGVKHSQQQ